LKILRIKKEFVMDYLDISPCPEDKISFLKDTDINDLIRWKLRGLLEEPDVDPVKSLMKSVVTDVELFLVNFALQRTRGNQSAAAELLGINRNTLHRKLKSCNMSEIEQKEETCPQM
jgi:DNA-binding protein Fis